jgi:hypothetical protein
MCNREGRQRVRVERSDSQKQIVYFYWERERRRRRRGGGRSGVHQAATMPQSHEQAHTTLLTFCDFDDSDWLATSSGRKPNRHLELLVLAVQTSNRRGRGRMEGHPKLC